MKYALITTIAALSFATAAAAEGDYAKDTIMTRNVPATSVLAPRDAALAKDGYVRVTVGDKLAEDASTLLDPSEAAIAQNGVVNSYTFAGSFLDTVKGSYSYR